MRGYKFEVTDPPLLLVLCYSWFLFRLFFIKYKFYRPPLKSGFFKHAACSLVKLKTQFYLLVFVHVHVDITDCLNYAIISFYLSVMTLFSLIDGIAEVSLQTHRNTADIAQLIMCFFDVLTVKFIQRDSGWWGKD